MNIDTAQYRKIVDKVYQEFQPGYRENSATLPPAEAELIVAIAQLAGAVDHVDDRDERALFDSLAAHVYAHANIVTTPSALAPIEDDEQRMDHLRNHAAQLKDKPSGALAYAIAYIVLIADLDLAPEEGELLDVLREALGIDEARGDELIATVSEILTPSEELDAQQ